MLNFAQQENSNDKTLKKTPTFQIEVQTGDREVEGLFNYTYDNIGKQKFQTSISNFSIKREENRIYIAKDSDNNNNRKNSYLGGSTNNNSQKNSELTTSSHDEGQFQQGGVSTIAQFRVENGFGLNQNSKILNIFNSKIINFQNHNDNYEINQKNAYAKLQQQLWYPVRNFQDIEGLKQNMFQVQKGDLIKFGKMIFFIREIQLQQQYLQLQQNKLDNNDQVFRGSKQSNSNLEIISDSDSVQQSNELSYLMKTVTLSNNNCEKMEKSKDLLKQQEEDQINEKIKCRICYSGDTSSSDNTNSDQKSSDNDDEQKQQQELLIKKKNGNKKQQCITDYECDVQYKGRGNFYYSADEENRDSKKIKIVEKLQNLNIQDNIKIKKKKKKKKIIQEDPLIQACRCQGSVRYIHLKCLQQWMKQRTQKVQNGNVHIYYCEKTLCEICKCRFPDRVEVQGKQFSVIDFQLPQDNYMVLEFIPNEKLDVKYYFVLDFYSSQDNNDNDINDNSLEGEENEQENNNQDQKNKKNSKNEKEIVVGSEGDIKLGNNRNFENENFNVRSMSKLHASFVYNMEKQQVFLKDHNSKFGTHVYLQKPYQLNPQEKVYLQQGQSLILVQNNSEKQIQQDSSTLLQEFFKKQELPIQKQQKQQHQHQQKSKEEFKVPQKKQPNKIMNMKRRYYDIEDNQQYSINQQKHQQNNRNNQHIQQQPKRKNKLKKEQFLVDTNFGYSSTSDRDDSLDPQYRKKKFKKGNIQQLPKFYKASANNSQYSRSSNRTSSQDFGKQGQQTLYQDYKQEQEEEIILQQKHRKLSYNSNYSENTQINSNTNNNTTTNNNNNSQLTNMFSLISMSSQQQQQQSKNNQINSQQQQQSQTRSISNSFNDNNSNKGNDIGMSNLCFEQYNLK